MTTNIWTIRIEQKLSFQNKYFNRGREAFFLVATSENGEVRTYPKVYVSQAEAEHDLEHAVPPVETWRLDAHGDPIEEPIDDGPSWPEESRFPSSHV